MRSCAYKHTRLFLLNEKQPPWIKRKINWPTACLRVLWHAVKTRLERSLQGQPREPTTPLWSLTKSTRYLHKLPKQHDYSNNMGDKQNSNPTSNITVKIKHKMLDDAVMDHGEYSLPTPPGISNM